VLFIDRVADPSTLCTWDTFDTYHRAEFVERITRFVDRIGS
jgi:peptide deformylase